MKPKRPSTTVGGPVRPACANSAATTPPCAAQPQCVRLTVPPVRLASNKPAPILAAIPIAELICSELNFISIAAATAEPRVPQIDVA